MLITTQRVSSKDTCLKAFLQAYSSGLSFSSGEGEGGGRDRRWGSDHTALSFSSSFWNTLAFLAASQQRVSYYAYIS